MGTIQGSETDTLIAYFQSVRTTTQEDVDAAYTAARAHHDDFTADERSAYTQDV